MTTVPSHATGLLASDARRPARAVAARYAQLTKARLSVMVLLTTAVGYIVASPHRIDWLTMLWTMLGTAMAAACAAALNQAIEVELDRRMHRTRLRPLVSGAMTLRRAWISGIGVGVLGVTLLALLVNAFAAVLALATIVIYVGLYTPLKTRSTLNTLVGAVCGALPPMIGWVAAVGVIEPAAWVLGALLFVWQLPHFFALAWLHREDYARGGFAMLPVIDRDGRITCQVIIITSLLLLPLALLATLLNLAGLWYAIGSLALGAWMIALSVRFYRRRTNANARGIFLASIAYLPALLSLLVIDRGPASAFAAVEPIAMRPAAPDPPVIDDE